MRPTHKTDYLVGDEVFVDDTWQGVVTRTSVYSGSQRYGVRQMGVSVRPIDGGRARVVSFDRIQSVHQTR